MMYLGTCAHAPTSSNKNDRALGCARLVNVVVAKFAESTLIRLHAGLELLVHLLKRTEYRANTLAELSSRIYLLDLKRRRRATIVRVSIQVQNFLALDGEQARDQALLHSGSEHNGIVLRFRERGFPLHHTVRLKLVRGRGAAEDEKEAAGQ